MISNVVTSLRIVLLVPLYALLLSRDKEFQWWALMVFLAAGFTDVLDGFLARRLNEASPFGAMLDLIADRLLTAGSLGALIAAGVLVGWGSVAAIILILRDLIVASLNEALPGRLGIGVSVLERVKITMHFIAAGLLIAPEFWRPAAKLSQHQLGTLILVIAATLAFMIVAEYWRRALYAFAAKQT